MKKIIISLAFIFCSYLLSSCDYLASNTTNIQQGNIIEEKEVRQIKIGMSKNKVTDIMGSAVLVNTFNENRWIYVYTSQIARKPLVRKRVIIWFKGGRVSKIQRG